MKRTLFFQFLIGPVDLELSGCLQYNYTKAIREIIVSMCQVYVRQTDDNRPKSPVAYIM